jgi:hypothetical protein
LKGCNKKRSLVSADSRRTKEVFFVTERAQCEYRWEEDKIESTG